MQLFFREYLHLPVRLSAVSVWIFVMTGSSSLSRRLAVLPLALGAALPAFARSAPHSGEAAPLPATEATTGLFLPEGA